MTRGQGLVVSVDVVLMTLLGDALHVLVHRRAREPFAGALALPGAFIDAHKDHDAESTAQRLLREKLGASSPYLEQLATFSGADRDPRGWSVAIAYYALVPASRLQLGEQAQLVGVDRLPPLAFDHRQILLAAVERVRNKSQYSSLPAHLLPTEFTLPELQRAYEQVLGTPLNKVSFRRKVDEMELLESIEGKLRGGAHRPAQLYRLARAFRHDVAVVQRGL
jgi:8-oxo-dGTP diphosphatase